MHYKEFKSCIDKLESHFGANTFAGTKRGNLWDAMRNEEASLLASSIDRMIDKLVKPPSFETAMKFFQSHKMYLQKGVRQGSSPIRPITRIEPFPDTPAEDTKFLMSFINARIANRIFDNEWDAYQAEVSRPDFKAKGAKARWREQHGECPAWAFEAKDEGVKFPTPEQTL